MSTASKSSVQAHWLAEQLLGWNCISYGNDTVTLLNIYAAAAPDNKEQVNYYAFPKADTTIASIEKYNDDVWTDIQIYNSRIQAGDLTISCGEGSMGNEGFIAAAIDNELAWALFSTESNPFIRLETAGQTLLAYSDYLLYTINLHDLAEIRISKYH